MGTEEVVRLIREWLKLEKLCTRAEASPKCRPMIMTPRIMSSLSGTHPHTIHFPGPAADGTSQRRCVLLLTMCVPRPGGTDPALCLFPKRAAWVALQLSTVPANELGALGLTNTFCVTGLTCDVSQGECPEALLFLLFFFCLVLSLIWDRQEATVESVVSLGSGSESCLGSLGQSSSPTEDTQNGIRAFSLPHSEQSWVLTQALNLPPGWAAKTQRLWSDLK